MWCRRARSRRRRMAFRWKSPRASRSSRHSSRVSNSKRLTASTRDRCRSRRVRHDRISNTAFASRSRPFKQTFGALQPGDSVVVQGPLGHYILDTSRPAVLVAGGIGITPLKGMAEYAADRRLSIPVRLVYSNRTVDEIVYREELEALERANANFRVLSTLTRPEADSLNGRTGRVAGHSGANFLAEAAEALDKPSTTYAARQASFRRAARAWSSPALPKPTSGSKSFGDMESQPDRRQRSENDRKFDSEITLRCKLLKTQDKFRGWEAGIRTPITWSRATCPTVERPPSTR